jgi:hypothetical protein
MIKLCVNCTHFETEGAICNSESSIKRIDLIFGNHEKMSADEMRKDKDKCGLAAKLFKPKQGFLQEEV